MRRSLILVAVLAALAGGCGSGGEPATPPALLPGPGGGSAGNPAGGGAVTGGPGAESGGAINASGPGAGTRHNAADVAFAQALIPHHREGIALASAAAATHPAAQTLAEAIIATQQDEVVRMTSWLGEWGVSAPPSKAPAPIRGDPLKALVAHQAAAIKIAQQEQGGGTNPTALDFARQIIESRTAQIEQLTT